MRFSRSTSGPVAKGAESVRSFGQIGRTVLLSTCHAIAQASLVMKTGGPRCRRKFGARRRELSNTWSLFMNFSIAGTMSRLCAPRHKLSCSWLLWRRLLAGLRQRGRHYSRESGAFLLGHRRGGRVRILQFVLYDDLDPGCLDTGIVRFDGRHFGKLWDLCQQLDLTVVADVHTHPGSSGQSDSDRANPMISRAGHLALIMPRFAAPPIRRSEIGMYRYEGDKRWSAVPVKDRRTFIHVGL
jgi:proteasome lid subunit RPN8/RPN11